MNLTRQTLTAALVALLAVGASGCSYNTFVTQEEAIKAQWAEIQNQLQRRSDLIPNLVETVKGVTQQTLRNRPCPISVPPWFIAMEPSW
jgi:LemA protein